MTDTAELCEDPDVRWLVVLADRARVENYAYGSTRVVVDNPGEGYGPVTTAIVLGSAGQEGHAQFLAEYQAGRLTSGGINSTICTSWAHAARVAREYVTGEWA